jgi:hypothetical protein
MSPSILSRAAAAAVLLTSTASAAFSLSSGNNVAIYWGQGAYQGPLSTVCMDPSIDVVNIAFVNGFPNKVGDYPNTNFGKEHIYLRPWLVLMHLRKRMRRRLVQAPYRSFSGQETPFLVPIHHRGYCSLQEERQEGLALSWWRCTHKLLPPVRGSRKVLCRVPRWSFRTRH